MLPDLTSLAAKLQVEREAITGLVQGLSEESLDRPGPEGGWSIREMLAHVVAAEHGLLGLARHIAAGENPQIPASYDLDAANAQQVNKRKGLSVAELLQEWEMRRANWQVFLEGISEPQLEFTGEHAWFHQQVTLRQLVIIMLKHERGHKQEIAGRLESQ